MIKIDKNYFPGFVRKSMTFSIDDGNVTLDKKFISYVKPAGIKGTFNLITPLNESMTYDDYRELYSGFGIANHVKYHPLPFENGKTYNISDELFTKDSKDVTKIYKTNEEGLYKYSYNGSWFANLADDDTYMKLVDECQKTLVEIFGKEKVRGMVWPYGRRANLEVENRLYAYGFQNIRPVVLPYGKDNFDMPKNRYLWGFAARHNNLCEMGEKYAQYPDDNKLKFFCFGIHSHDFENDHLWGELEKFCATYGNQPQNYYYASVEEIFDYEDAVNRLVAIGKFLENPSSQDLYLTIDGEKTILKAKSRIILSDDVELV